MPTSKTDPLAKFAAQLEELLRNGPSMGVFESLNRLLPAARTVSCALGDDADVDADFEAVRQALANPHIESAVIRQQLLAPAAARIASRLLLRQGLQQLAALEKSKADPIGAFLKFATVALNLWTDVRAWFPERTRPVDGLLNPKERRVFATALAPQFVPNVDETIYARAQADARRRKIEPSASPRLREIRRLLGRLAEALLDEATAQEIGPALLIELAQAISGLQDLLRESTVVATAAEACAVLGDSWATIAQLASVTGLSAAALRSRLGRNGNRISASDVQSIKLPTRGSPVQRFRIAAVWRFLRASALKKK